MSKATKILDNYYDDITAQVYPDWDDREFELLDSAGLSAKNFMVVGLYEIKPEYADAVGPDYKQVYYVSTYGYPYFDSIAPLSDVSYDITNDVYDQITAWENGEDWSEEGMLSRGKEIYDQYGPDWDTSDMTEFDAESYYAYKRSIGE